MSWLRVDDDFPQHPKVAPLSDAAFRLHVTAKAYCTKNGTDGHLERSAVPNLTAAPKGKRLARVIAELTVIRPYQRHPLWEETSTGWVVHDFLDYNLSAADWRSLKQARSEAGKRGGTRSAEVRGKKNGGNGGSNGGANGQASASPNPEQAPSKPPANGPAKSNPDPEPLPEGHEPTDIQDPVVLGGACRSCKPPLPLGALSLNAFQRANPTIGPYDLQYACRWQLGRGGAVDLRDLHEAFDALVPIHGRDEVRAHFWRLTDPAMPATEHRFHTLRTFRTNFHAYGPTFDPATCGQRKGQQRVATGDQVDWDQEVSDVRVG